MVEAKLSHVYQVTDIKKNYMRDLKVAVVILLTLVVSLMALMTILYKTKRPQRCTKVHLKSYEYRLIADGTDSILEYTILAPEGDTLGCEIPANQIDDIINQDNY